MKLYYVNEHISIDESMILFQGRSTLKQYNPLKPIKCGYKLWAHADNDGYISKFSIYQGKHGETEKVDVPDCFGLGEKVVIHLTSDLVGKNHKVYFDTYYSSIPLAEYLLLEKVFCCGTIRSNRKYLPKDLKCDKDLKRGDSDSRVSAQGIILYKWMDNKPVHLVPNYHGTETSEIKWTQKDGSKMVFTCPRALNCYNDNMDGVDKANFYCTIYGMNRKHVKWWHRMFFGLIDRVISDAYVAFCNVTGQKVSSLLFRHNVTFALLTLGRPHKIGQALATSSPMATKKHRKPNFSVPDTILLENLGAHWPVFGEKQARCFSEKQ